MTDCPSHETFALFGLEASHFNNCYYHQDLHYWEFHGGSHRRFDTSVRVCVYNTKAYTHTHSSRSPNTSSYLRGCARAG